MLNDVLLRGLASVQTLRARTRGESGQTLAEYSLLITVIAVAVVVLAVVAFREALADAFNAATGCLDGTC